MRYLAICFGIIFAGQTILAQTPNPPYNPNNPLPDWVYKTAEERRKMNEITGRTPDGMIAGRPDGRLGRLPTTRPNGKPYTKKELEKIAALLRPAPEDLETYKWFLLQPGTGIFRLFPFYDCYSKNLIKADGPCADFIADSWAFSFRREKYGEFYDLGLVDGKLVSDSFFTQGMMIALGDVGLENLSTASSGIRFLVDFRPAENFEDAKFQSKKIGDGFDFGGFRFSNKLVPEVGKTYALRVIAYRLKHLPKPNFQPNENIAKRDLRFSWLESDKRVDVLVAFRVVRREADGNLTILWKELQRLESPKIKFSKKEIIRDFK